MHRQLDEGLPDGQPGVGFFVTTFDLRIPEYLDVPISFVFDNIEQPYRAYLFVNGWMMGKRAANLGCVLANPYVLLAHWQYSPQYRFPVPEGILDFNGSK
jgi:hypothetical protein